MRVDTNILNDLNLIASYIENIQNKKDIKSNLRGIERILNRIFDLNITVQLVDNNTNKFFGMTVTPERMDRILMAILEERSTKEKLYEVWREEKNWILEIDDLLLYDKNLNASSHEIVAVMLHEIGHVVYSNEAVSRINRVIKMTLMQTDVKYKAILSDSKFMKLLQIPLYEGCATKRFKINLKNHDSEEYKADKFVQMNGYQDHLISFIDKLLKTRGNGLINKTSDEMDKDVEILVNWTLDNVSSLEYRKNKLKHSIYIEKQRNPSEVIKKIMDNIKKSILGDDNTDTIASVMQEQYLYDNIKSIIKEATKSDTSTSKKSFNINISKIKKINMSELDIIDIEIDRIQYSDDKIYILEKIYALMEKVDDMLLLIESGQSNKVAHSKATVIDMQTKLADMRTRVLSTKILDKEYGLFIKYPKGYEG